MSYIINVAKATKEYPNGLHDFCVDLGQICQSEAFDKFDLFNFHFPASNGYFLKLGIRQTTTEWLDTSAG